MMLFYYLHVESEEDNESFSHNNQPLGRKPYAKVGEESAVTFYGYDVMKYICYRTDSWIQSRRRELNIFNVQNFAD
jgi:hypothetical protein